MGMNRQPLQNLDSLAIAQWIVLIAIALLTIMQPRVCLKGVELLISREETLLASMVALLNVGPRSMYSVEENEYNQG
jgi:hypothetical protein